MLLTAFLISEYCMSIRKDLASRYYFLLKTNDEVINC